MPQYIYYQWKQYPVPIQYSLPKWINSVEAGLLVDGSIEDEDIFSLIYEWDNKWIINMEKQGQRIKIEEIKWLADDAKNYEKYIYNGLFSKDKISAIRARVLIMDYCFKKWWIKNFWPTLKGTLNEWILWTLFIAFWLYILSIAVRILIFFLWESWLSWLLFIVLSLFNFSLFAPVSFFIISMIFSFRIIIEKIKTVKIERTNLWIKIQSQLLWYKKYLDQIKLRSSHHDNESIEVQYGTAAHNIALKTDNTYYTLKQMNGLMHSKFKDLQALSYEKDM